MEECIPSKEALLKALNTACEANGLPQVSMEEYERTWRFVNVRDKAIRSIKNDNMACYHLTDLMFNLLTDEGKKKIISLLQKEFD